MITRRGVGLVLTAVGIFFLASITRVGWLHLADAVMWAMIVVGLALPWLTVPGLRAARRSRRAAPEMRSLRLLATKLTYR